MQDYAALKRKAEDEIQARIVIELERKDDPRITKEHKGNGQDSGERRHGERGKKHASKESEQEEKPDFISGNRIDIRI
jgi:hypothetical protein